MTSSDRPSIGVVEAPELAHALTLLGFNVVGGGEFRSAALAIRQQPAGTPTPVIVFDVTKPGLRAWVEKESNNGSRVVVLRGALPGPITPTTGVSVPLPADINTILAAAGWGPTPHPLGAANVSAVGAIAELTAYGAAETVQPQPVEQEPISPVFEQPAPAPVFEQPTPAPALPAVEAPAGAAPTVEAAAAANPALPDWFNEASTPAQQQTGMPDWLQEMGFGGDATAQPDTAVTPTAPAATEEVAAPAVPVMPEIVEEPADESLYPTLAPVPAPVDPDEEFDALFRAATQAQNAPVPAVPVQPAVPQPVVAPGVFEQMVANAENTPAAPAWEQQVPTFTPAPAPAPAPAPTAPLAPGAEAGFPPASPLQPFQMPPATAPAVPDYTPAPAAYEEAPVAPAPVQMPAFDGVFDVQPAQAPAPVPAPVQVAPQQPYQLPEASPQAHPAATQQPYPASAPQQAPQPYQAPVQQQPPFTPVQQPQQPVAPVQQPYQMPAPVQQPVQQPAQPETPWPTSATGVPIFDFEVPGTVVVPAPAATPQAPAQPWPPTPATPAIEPGRPAAVPMQPVWEQEQPAQAPQASGSQGIPGWNAWAEDNSPMQPHFEVAIDPGAFGQNNFGSGADYVAPQLEKVLISVAGKGGVGKSSLALAMAEEGTAAGLRVALVDMNRGQGDIRIYLRLQDQNVPTIYNAALSGNIEDGILTPDMLTDRRARNLPPLGFAIVLAPPPELADPAIVTTDVYRKTIEFLTTKVDLVIVDTQIAEAKDTSGLHDDLVIPMLLNGAHALGITDMSSAGLNNLLDLVKRFATHGINRESMMLAANMASEFDEKSQRTITELFGAYATFAGAAGADPAFKDRMNEGVIAVADSPIRPLIRRILLQATSDERFKAVAQKKRGLFGRRR